MKYSYEKVLEIDCRPEAGFGEAYFKVIVETEYRTVKVWEINRMCDSFTTFSKKTGKQRITVVATDKFHNMNDDFKPFVVELDTELARKVIAVIINDEKDLLWFTKDRLSYAAKHGEVI